MTVEQLVEQVRSSVVTEVQEMLKPVVEVLLEMDGFIRAHDEALTQLVESDAAKVKGIIEGGDWFKNLYIRSRDAEATEPTKDTQSQEGGVPQVRELEAGETPSSVIFGQNKA